MVVGIAKQLGDASRATDESLVLGTPPFMSPEQCRGADGVEQRSDVAVTERGASYLLGLAGGAAGVAGSAGGAT